MRSSVKTLQEYQNRKFEFNINMAQRRIMLQIFEHLNQE